MTPKEHYLFTNNRSQTRIVYIKDKVFLLTNKEIITDNITDIKIRYEKPHDLNNVTFTATDTATNPHKEIKIEGEFIVNNQGSAEFQKTDFELIQTLKVKKTRLDYLSNSVYPPVLEKDTATCDSNKGN